MYCNLTLCVLTALLLICGAVRAEPPASSAPPAKETQFVTVETTFVEVNLTKLRAIGLDWLEVNNRDHATKLFSDAKKSSDFVRALEQNGLLNSLHRPSVMTLSGRAAYVDLSPHLKLDVVPIILESGRIRVEHRLELSERKFKSESAVEVESGLAAIASRTSREQKDASGKVTEFETLVIVRATTESPQRQAAGAAVTAQPETR